MLCYRRQALAQDVTLYFEQDVFLIVLLVSYHHIPASVLGSRTTDEHVHIRALQNLQSPNAHATPDHRTDAKCESCLFFLGPCDCSRMCSMSSCPGERQLHTNARMEALSL